VKFLVELIELRFFSLITLVVMLPERPFADLVFILRRRQIMGAEIGFGQLIGGFIQLVVLLL